MKPKQLYLLGCIAIAMAFLVSCENDTKKQQEVGVKTTNQFDVIKNSAGTINTTINLMETTPISFEALEDWFPENLLDLQLETVEKGSLSANGITSMVGHYKSDNNESFDLLINDAAGKNGSIVVGSFSMYKNMKVDREDDYKLETSFKNGKLGGIETFHKKSKESMISGMYGDRFAIVISSKQMERDMVWNAIEKLPFNNLTN